MDTFYTVDRSGNLEEGDVIHLQHYNDVKPHFLQEHVDSMFSDGFSKHGERYLLKNDSAGNISNPAIELFFEYVRQAHFPTITSRFQSFFACQSIEDAFLFKEQYGKKLDRVFQVQTSNSYFKGDMKLLNNNRTSLVCSYFAHQYWKGDTVIQEDESFWEILLTLPITIGLEIQNI